MAMTYWKEVRVGRSKRWAFQDPAQTPKAEALSSSKAGATVPNAAPSSSFADPGVTAVGGPKAPRGAKGATATTPTGPAVPNVGSAPLRRWLTKVYAAAQSPDRLSWKTRANVLPPIPEDPQLVAGAPRSHLVDWLVSMLPPDFFHGVTVMAALHGTSSQEVLIEAFLRLGADARDIYFAPVPYSADIEPQKRLARRGVNVIQPQGSKEFHLNGLPGPANEDASSKQRRENLNRRMSALEAGVENNPYRVGRYDEARKLQIKKMVHAVGEELPMPGSPLLVLDDGGLVVRDLHENALRAEKPPDVPPDDPLFVSAGRRHFQQGGLTQTMLADATSVEQTTRGKTELAETDLQMSVVDVAGSAPKEIEGGFIGDDVWNGILPLLSELGHRSAEGKTVVQVGFGKTGRAAAETAKALGFKVIVVDASASRRDEAKALGMETLARLEDAVSRADVVVAMTGHLSLTQGVLEKLKEDALVVSGSSGEIEGDVQFLARRHAALPREYTNTLDADGVQRRIGPDETTGVRTYFLGDRRFFVAKGLRPVNFEQGGESLPMEKIELTRATMLVAAVQAVMQRKSKQLLPLDPDVVQSLIEEFNKTPHPRTTPTWPTHDLRAEKRAQFQKLNTLLEARTDAFTLQQKVNAFDALLGADEVFPATPNDADNQTGVVARLPSGQLMLAGRPVAQHFVKNGVVTEAVAPAFLAVLPIKNETPRRLELLGWASRLDEAPSLTANELLRKRPRSLMYALQTVDAEGKKRVRLLNVAEAATFLPGDKGPPPVQVGETYDDGEIMSVFTRDKRDGTPLAQFKGLPPRVTGFNDDPNLETRVLIKTPDGVMDVGTAETMRLHEPIVAAYGDRWVLSPPPQLALRLGDTLHTVDLSKEMVEVREVLSHFNRDLVRGVAADGHEVLVPLRWPVEWRTTAWPPGDVQRSDDTTHDRRTYTPQKREDTLPKLDMPTLGRGLTLLDGLQLRRLTFDESKGAWELQLFDPTDHDEAEAWVRYELKSP